MTQTVFARHILRWEADVPLLDEQRAAFLLLARESLAPLGEMQADYDDSGDALIIRLQHTRFPAALHRDTALWLCAHKLMEKAALSLEQEGTMLISGELPPQEDALPSSLDEISDWWNGVSPMPGAQARLHRTQLQTIIKRRQYTALGGYVSRQLRSAPEEAARLCFAFVPMVIEAVWSLHAELPLDDLIAPLSLSDMARRPREALLAWFNALPPLLRQSPAASAAPIERVIAGIRADCSLPYSQQNLSRSLGLTPAYFCRLFHEKTGQHFSTFLTRTRMEKAQELLSGGQDISLAQVSAACGYPNRSYFSQVFKKYTGMTPGEFEQRSKQ